MSDKKKNILKVVGLAVGLPSSILSIFILVYILMDKDIISETGALIMILLIIASTFFLMVRYAIKK